MDAEGAKREKKESCSDAIIRGTRAFTFASTSTRSLSLSPVTVVRALVWALSSGHLRVMLLWVCSFILSLLIYVCVCVYSSKMDRCFIPSYSLTACASKTDPLGSGNSNWRLQQTGMGGGNGENGIIMTVLIRHLLCS